MNVVGGFETEVTDEAATRVNRRRRHRQNLPFS